MQLIYDTIDFLKSVAFVDVIFFLAILVLMLLIITLIYFIKENNEDTENADISKLTELDFLKEITEEIENSEPKEISLNNYEEEQEEKAIISYDELIKHKNNFALNYSEEETINDDIKVKKVDLDNLVNKDLKVESKVHGAIFNYEKEEAFLAALRALQQTLN
ncbi:MAG: hypothetical protein NC483_06525 [Ruminococcus sp.]|nr:hypothetical protein [Ruminococcus sp.]